MRRLQSIHCSKSVHAMKISHRVYFFRWVVLTAVLFSLLVSSAFAEDTATPEQADAYSGVADASQMTTVEDVVEEGMIPLDASSLQNGVYPVAVDCSSSMFRIESCILTVADGAISARLYMGSSAFTFLYPGTAQEAASADHALHIPVQEDETGACFFDIPVSALDAGIPCAAFSKNKELWYDRTLVFRSDSLPVSAFAGDMLTTPEYLNLADGEYTVEVTLSGGSGKAKIASPARLHVSNGNCTAEIVWGSKNYDYMKVEGVQYFPLNEEGNSAFEIPVLLFDRPMPVIADTIAMSRPHEIEYTLLFSSESLKRSEPQHMELAYARQFTVDYAADGTALLTIAGKDQFRLVPRDIDYSSRAEDGIPCISVPVSSIYLASSSAADFFVQLDALSSLGLVSTSAENWTIPAMRQAMERQEILYAGKYSAPDYELLLTEGCSLAVENTMILHSPAVKEKLETLGLPVIVEYSSYEPHPLGRVEWIKLYGLLTGREEEAERFFTEQVQSLDALQNLEQTEQKVAFFYVGSNGIVNVRKPSDYVTRMIEIAGGVYPFTDIPETDNALSTMNMQMESFFAQARDCDVLIYNSTVDGGITTMDQLLQKSPLFAEFDAVKNGRVWCTEQDMFQQTSAAARMILDINAVLTQSEPRNLAFLQPVQS